MALLPLSQVTISDEVRIARHLRLEFGMLAHGVRWSFHCNNSNSIWILIREFRDTIDRSISVLSASPLMIHNRNPVWPTAEKCLWLQIRITYDIIQKCILVFINYEQLTSCTQLEIKLCLRSHFKNAKNRTRRFSRQQNELKNVRRRNLLLILFYLVLCLLVPKAKML